MTINTKRLILRPWLKEEVTSIVNGLAQIVVPVYEDVAQPATRDIGKALQTVVKTIHVALAPISAFIWGYENIKDFICEKAAPITQVTTDAHLILRCCRS